MDSRFKAFISYSHAADSQFAPQLQMALHRFARKWYAFRAMRTFRDQTTLALTPELWPSIVSALDDCEFFVLLASLDAAESEWVDKEASHWLETRTDGAKKILLVVTDGEVVWDASRSAFEPSGTTCLPKSLLGTLAHEPMHLDLRWARTSSDLSLQNPRFKDAVATLSAALLGKDKDQLIGQDVEEQRRLARVTRWGVGSIATLAVLAAAAAWWANSERNQKETERRIAVARQFAAQSRLELLRPGGLTQRSLLTALQSITQERTPEGVVAWRTALDELPRLQRNIALDGTVRALRFTANGRYLIATLERSIDVIDTERGWTRRRIPVSAPITAVAVSPSSDDVLLIATAEALEVRRLSDSSSVARIPELRQATKLQFSGSGARAGVIDSDGKLRLIDTSRWELREEYGPQERVNAFAFDPVSSAVLVASRDATVLWEPKPRPSGAAMHVLLKVEPGSRFDPPVDKTLGASPLAAEILRGAFGSAEEGIAVTFSTTGRHLAIGTANGTVIAFRRGTPWSRVADYRTRARRIEQVLFAADERVLFARSLSASVMVCDLSTKEVASTIRADGLVSQMLLTPGGELITSSADGAIRVWDVSTGRHRLRADSEAEVADVALHPRQPIVAFGDGSRQLQIRRLEPVGAWDMLTESFLSQTYSISLNRARGLLAVGGDPFVARLWSYPDLKLLQNLSLVQPAGGAGGGTAGSLGLHLPLDVTISPDGKLVASVAGTEVLVWKSADGRRVAAVETPADTYAVAFDHSGASLFAAGASNAVYVWKTDSFTFERVFDVGAAVANLAPHPSLSRISVGTANSIVLLDTGTGAIEWRTPASSPVPATAFSPDGTLVAAGDAAGRLMLIDAATGKVRWTRQHEEEIRRVDFSPDGRSVLSASGSPITQMRLAGDSSVRVWTLLGEPVLRMDEAAPTGGATFDGDGRIVAAHARMIRRIGWQRPALVDKACAALSRNLTLNEWTSLVPDRPYEPTCIKLPPHPSTQSPYSH